MICSVEERPSNKARVRRTTRKPRAKSGGGRTSTPSTSPPAPAAKRKAGAKSASGQPASTRSRSKAKGSTSARGRKRTTKRRDAEAIRLDEARRIQSDLTPAWDTARWEHFAYPRERYLGGTWDYARGRAATEHPRYADAVAIARGEARWQDLSTKRPSRSALVESLIVESVPDAVRTFNPWWIRSWQDVEAVLDGCWFGEDKGWGLCRFFQRFLRLSKGDAADQPFPLMDFQVYDLLAPLNGWRRANGLRRYRDGGLWIPKKNGKSSLVSGLPIFFARDKSDPGAECYCVAGALKQTRAVFEEVRKIIKKLPDTFRRKFRVVASDWTIFYEELDAMIAALSAEADLQEGINASLLLFDELHVQKNWEMWNTLRGSSVARKQPLHIYMSTAGDYDPESVGWHQWLYSERVREGEVSDWSYFSLCYQADPKSNTDKSWRDPEQWIRANPGIGQTVQYDALAEDAQRSEGIPREVRRFKRYHANIWVQQTARWLPHGAWKRCAESYEIDAFTGKTVFAGIDLGSTDDTTSLQLFLPGSGGERHRIFSWFWVPGENLEQLASDHGVPYGAWNEAGYLETTPGNATDYRYCYEKLLWLRDEQEVRIHEVRFDSYNAGSLVTDLDNKGFEMHKQSQALGPLASAVRELELCIRKGQIGHPDHPVMNWQIGNCRVYRDMNDNPKLAKAEGRGGKGKGEKRYKIDGPYALLNATKGWQEADQNGWTADDYRKTGLTVAKRRRR